MKLKSLASVVVATTACLCALPAAAAVPVIDTESVSITQGRGRSIVIEYKMNPASAVDQELAVVTVDILTNDVSVGGRHLRTLSGDVNRLVQHTADYKHKILWSPTKEGLPEFTLPAAQVKAQITAWSTNSPPTYWIIDLTNPADRLADRYYTDAEQIPGTVTNILYKKDRLVMRRIPAKGVTWKMGGTTTYGVSTYHYVSFSYDYYMAIYEFTDAQYNHIRGTWAARPDDALPTMWNFENWRGNPAGASAYNWPSNGHDSVESGRIIGKLRTAVGGIPIDMSTSSEWEFACRAGTSTQYCNGDTEEDLAKVAWYSANADGVVHEVGLKEPNAWGLYDMHGNAAEFCLDKCSKLPADPVWDPTGPMQGDIVFPTDKTSRILTLRGGGRWGDYASWSADYCTSFAVNARSATEAVPTVRLTLLLH